VTSHHGFAATSCFSIIKNISDFLLYGRESHPAPLVRARPSIELSRLELGIERMNGNSGRHATYELLLISRQRTKVIQGLMFDQPEYATEALKPVYRSIYLAFHTIQLNEKVKALLQERVASKAQTGDLEGAKSALRELLRDWPIESAAVPQAQAASEPTQLIRAIEAIQLELDTHSSYLAKQGMRRLGVFAVTYRLLGDMSHRTDRVGENAKKVLQKLWASEVIKDYFDDFGFRQGYRSRHTPDPNEVMGLFRSFPEARVDYARWASRWERLIQWLSFSPTDRIADWVDRFIATVPGLRAIRGPRLRAFFELLRTESSNLIYDGDIERIIESDASIGKKLEQLKAFNAGTNDRFLIGFARRVDVAEMWAQLKTEAQKEEGHHFFNRMVAAENTARELDYRYLWIDRSRSTIVRHAADLALTAGLGYFGWNAVSSVVSNATGSTSPSKTGNEDNDPSPDEVEGFINFLESSGQLTPSTP